MRVADDVASPAPASSPKRTGRVVCANIKSVTLREAAPSAIRTPISLVRCSTRYDNTLKSPDTVSNSARPPRITDTQKRSRPRQPVPDCGRPPAPALTCPYRRPAGCAAGDRPREPLSGNARNQHGNKKGQTSRARRSHLHEVANRRGGSATAGSRNAVALCGHCRRRSQRRAVCRGGSRSRGEYPLHGVTLHSRYHTPDHHRVNRFASGHLRGPGG